MIASITTPSSPTNSHHNESMASAFGLDIFWTDHIINIINYSKNKLGRQNLLCQSLIEIKPTVNEKCPKKNALTDGLKPIVDCQKNANCGFNVFFYIIVLIRLPGRTEFKKKICVKWVSRSCSL